MWCHTSSCACLCRAMQSAGGFAPVIRVVVNRSETLAGAAKQAEDAATAAQCKSKRLALVYLLDNVIQV